MALRAVNEEEFVEAETKRIKTFIKFSSIWLLLLPPAFLFILLLSLETGSIAVFLIGLILLLGFPPVLILTLMRRREKVYGLWISGDKIVFALFKYLPIAMVAATISFFEYPLYLWLKYGGSFQFYSAKSTVLLLSFLLPASVFVFGVKIQQKMSGKFKLARNVRLNIPPRSAKEIILKALENLNITYFKPQGRLNANNGQKFVELESGIQIGVIVNFRDSAIRISDIPKNDTLEPEIEREILRLANLRESN